MTSLEPLSAPKPKAIEEPWEKAYLTFETSEEEIRKFMRRLRSLGAAVWPRDAEIVELFCGRGNGLHALKRLGFDRVEGVDISPSLLNQYSGDFTCHTADCRKLPFESASKDVLIVQGGLHHLSELPSDLQEVFVEMHRVLKRGGRVVFVEPWLTPFLHCVHVLCEIRVIRTVSPKMDALATMIEHERRTYYQWLLNPAVILNLAHKWFTPSTELFRWGKWNFVGQRGE